MQALASAITVCAGIILAIGTVQARAAMPVTVMRVLSLSTERARRVALGNSDFSWIAGGHRLIFSTTATNGSHSIYVYDVEAKRTFRIIGGEKPEPSPDGRKLAFIAADSRKSLGTKDVLQIWICNSDGSNPVQITKSPIGFGSYVVSSFHWAPDSRHLLYGRIDFTPPAAVAGQSTVEVYTRGYKGPQPHSSLHVLDPANGTDREVISRSGFIGTYGWLNATSIFYSFSQVVAPGTDAKVMARSITSGDERVLISGYNLEDVYGPTVSPSGDRIAFIADPGEAVRYPVRRELAVYSVASKDVAILTHYAIVSPWLVWRPDGQGVIHTEGRFNSRELFSTSLDGQSRALTRGPGLNSAPKFSSDGKYLVWQYTSLDQRRVLRIARWGGGALMDVRDLLELENPLEGFRVGPTKALQWKSADGSIVDGVLILPPDYDRRRRYPLIVDLHGGPEGVSATLAQSGMPTEGFFPYIMANFGYAILVPDYRASGLMGYDKILSARDHNQLFEPDFEDIDKGADSLVAGGIADPRRLFLIGHSWGGDETNYIITHSHRYRAAISYEGSDALTSWAWINATVHGVNTSSEWDMRGSLPWITSACTCESPQW
ncbi:MAG: prolyl oligopeptidase family serine peptidase [Rhizomicrobium sp.]